MRTITLACIVACLGFPATAATGPDTLVLGEGTMSCGQWVHFRQTTENPDLAKLAAAWVRGFISGVNAATPKGSKVGEGSDPEDNNLWLDNYCKAHPLDELAFASVALWNALAEKKR